MRERGNTGWGVAWIAWCAFAFVVVLGGGSVLVERLVVVPHCVEACAAEGLRFERFRVGSRSGPSSACLCEGERAIETSLGDVGTACSVLGFLAISYAPILLFEIRNRRGRRGRGRARP